MNKREEGDDLPDSLVPLILPQGTEPTLFDRTDLDDAHNRKMPSRENSTFSSHDSVRGNDIQIPGAGREGRDGVSQQLERPGMKPARIGQQEHPCLVDTNKIMLHSGGAGYTSFEHVLMPPTAQHQTVQHVERAEYPQGTTGALERILDRLETTLPSSLGSQDTRRSAAAATRTKEKNEPSEIIGSTGPSRPAGAGGIARSAEGERLVLVVPNAFDILSGRGRRIQTNPGNVLLHKVVDLQRDRYSSAPRTERRDIAETIVQALNANGNRFLARVVGTELLPEGWKEITHEEAVEKVAHCFRSRRSP